MSRAVSFPSLVLSFTLFWGAPVSLGAQETPSDDLPFSFGLNAALGNETLDNTNYQYLTLLPDLGYGPWGVGFDLSIHFELTRNSQFGFYPRSKDWWDSDLSLAKNLDKTLGRFAYVRYGKKGQPLYLQLGWLPSTSLGTGFLVGGYDNGALRPETRLTGLIFDASGSLFEAPWIGIESFVGSVSTFDLLGGRLYAKPLSLVAPDNPILKDLEMGVTVVADTNPYAHVSDKGGSVVAAGLDTLVPLYSSELFTTRATLDVTAEGSHWGGAAGVDGTAVKFLTWGLQFRALGENFLPQYFDRGYELNRAKKYAIYQGTVTVPATLGWQTALGTSLLGDAFQLGFILAGPFGSAPTLLAQPRLTGYGLLKPGLLPVDFSAYYVKNGVTSWSRLSSPEDALIGARVSYVLGVVTLSVVYDLKYDDVGVNGNKWVTTSRIETAVKLF